MQVTVNGAELHYDDINNSGAGDDEVVVWGHGFLYNAELYRSMRDFMPTYRHVAVDFRGHGRSAGVTDDATISRMADDTWELVAALGISRFFYIGHSMGSAVGLQLASRHPDAVIGAVGIAGVPLKGLPDSSRVYSKVFASICGDKEAFADMVVQVLAHEDTKTQQIDMIRACGASAALVAEGPLVNIAETELYLDNSAEIQPNLTQPWMFLIPANDLSVEPDAQLATARAIPGARAVLLNGEGHIYPQERPREAAAYVTAFLSTAR